MEPGDLDFIGAVSVLQGWLGQQVAVTVSYMRAVNYAAGLTGTLNRANEPVAGTDPISTEQKIRVLREQSGRQSDFERFFDPATAGLVLYFSVGTDTPDESSVFTLDEGVFTAARLGENRSVPPRPLLTVLSGVLSLGVGLHTPVPASAEGP